MDLLFSMLFLINLFFPSIVPVYFSIYTYILSGGCRSGYSEWNGNCYVLISVYRSWQDASADCQARGGGWLATITSDAEQNFLFSICTQCWIGYNDLASEGTFVWQVGGNGYTKWGPGEPNDVGGEDCAYGIAGLWNDAPCSTSLPYFCQTCQIGAIPRYGSPVCSPLPSSQPSRQPSRQPSK